MRKTVTPKTEEYRKIIESVKVEIKTNASYFICTTWDGCLPDKLSSKKTKGRFNKFIESVSNVLGRQSEYEAFDFNKFVNEHQPKDAPQVYLSDTEKRDIRVALIDAELERVRIQRSPANYYTRTRLWKIVGNVINK